MIELPRGVKTMTICWAIFIWYRNVTEGQTDGRTDIFAISISHVSMLTRDTNCNKNLAIANRSRVSCAHNSLRASPWPWNLR